jgi:hypothetical protein
MAIAAAALSIVPNLPDFGRGLTHTAFFFTQHGGPVRICASLVLGFIALVLGSIAITSNINRLAVWIEGDELFWRGLTVRKLPLASIKSVALTAAGVIRIERTDAGKPVEIAASLMRSRSDFGNVIRALQASVTH